MSDDGSTHVVVCGGDFAGNAAMRRLVGEPRVRVTLLDKFQPLLYQVATAELTAEDVCCDLAKMFCRHIRVEVRISQAVAVNPWTGTVTLARGNASNMSVGGLIELVLGVNAERKSLETIAKPLTAVSE